MALNINFPIVNGADGGQNLALTEQELQACKPIGGGRNVLRAYCPFHRSDHKRSLAVYLDTGRFKCFACEAWGYIKSPVRLGKSKSNSPARGIYREQPREKAHQSQRPDLPEVLATYQRALPRSRGEEYLLSRGLPLILAQQYGLGYAEKGKWIHPARDWINGRVVIPHTDPSGRIVSLYGRAVGRDESTPGDIRHDHLPGPKGYFNAMALNYLGPVFITEGPFDALSIIAASNPCTAAIFGVSGWRWDWANGVKKIVLALDADAVGKNKFAELAREAVLLGKEVFHFRDGAYGKFKDANDAWVNHSLNMEA
jgi:DNA primase